MTALQFDVSHTLAEATDFVKRPGFSKADAADIGFLCREISRSFDELRKEAGAREALAGASIAAAITGESLTNPNVSTTVRGTLCSASADTKMEAVLPRKGTADYQSLLSFFGATEKMIEEGCLKPDWKTIQEVVTRLVEDGKTIPPGCGRTYPRFFCKYRRREQ